jgi:hypothetical protein
MAEENLQREARNFSFMASETEEQVPESPAFNCSDHMNQYRLRVGVFGLVSQVLGFLALRFKHRF